jgi:hypothetical protein
MPLIGALALLAALVDSPPAASRHFVRVDAGGWATVPDAVPKSLSEGEALWSWSEECAPARQSDTAPPACDAVTPAEIQVTTRTKLPPGGTELRWGTKEMLAVLPDAMLPLAIVDAAGKAVLPAGKGRDLFVRAAGPRLASGWTAVKSPGTTLAAGEGVLVDIGIAEGGGKPARHARLEIRTADLPQPEELAFRGSGDARVRLPPIPAGVFVKVIGWSDVGAPTAVTVPASRLPRGLELPRGYEVSGTTIDEGREPLTAVAFSVRFVVGGDRIELVKRALSDSKGTFVLRGIPAGTMQWTAARAPLATLSAVLRVSDDVDLGAIALGRARDVAVKVLGQQSAPVAGAFVSTPGITARTDAHGIAHLVRVPADEVAVSIAARGYLDTEERIGPRAALPVVVKLVKGATVRAHLVRADDGKPAGPGSASYQLDGMSSSADFGDDGVLAIDGLTGGTLSVVIRADGASPFHLPQRVVREGEEVELGTIRLDRGLSIIGRTLDGDSGQPLANVIVRALRPGAVTPAVAYVQQDWVEGRSDADGAFRLGGLAPGSYSLWTQAAGHAPYVKANVQIDSALAEGQLDLGDVSIPAGRTLVVHCRPAERCGTEARVVLEGADWLPTTSPMAAGEATLAPLPAGSGLLRLSDRRGTITERDVALSSVESVTTVDLRLQGVRVSGEVLRGGKAVSGGRVTLKSSGGPSFFVQIGQPTSAGAIGDETIGNMPRVTSAEVSAEGRFTVQDLAPGNYAVTWWQGNTSSPERTISVPEGADFSTRIELPGAGLEGVVRSDAGPLPPQVVVTLQQRSTRSTTLAGTDGAFSFIGLEPGSATVRATAPQAEGEESVTVEEGRTAHVAVTLHPKTLRDLTVVVRSAQGTVPNAIVFIREDGNALRSATAGADGRATFRVSQATHAVELAAWSPVLGWSFAASRPLAESDTELPVDLQPAAGAVVVLLVQGSAALTIRAPTGFPIDQALLMLGVLPVARAGAPFRLERLPAGDYAVGAGALVRNATVSREPVEIAF